MSKARVKRLRIRRLRRGAQGIYIVEILVSLIVGAIVAVTLMNMVSVAMTSSTTCQNETYANEIVEELLDYTRVVDYDVLEDAIGSHVLQINEGGLGEHRPGEITVPPLLLDSANRKWRLLRTVGGRFNDNNSVTYSIYRLPSTTDALKVTISVSFTDSYRHAHTAGSYNPTHTRRVTATIIKMKTSIDMS